MAEPGTEPFEMRRLESLSNTIFGVAMTLLAYDLPKPAAFDAVPGWGDLYRLYGGRLSALTLSFIIAGLFWISHHRRLAAQPEGHRAVVVLNLFFLLSIILLPVSNGLYANYARSGVLAVLYGLHLAAIAGLNAWLWALVPNVRPNELAAAVFPIAVFLAGTAVALVEPHYAQYLWFLAFGGFFVRRLLSAPPAGAK